jgi:hypothetical protein
MSIIRFVILPIFIVAAMYGLVGFIAWDWNAESWEPMGRFLFSLCSLYAAVIAIDCFEVFK